ncbi:MAG: leucyl/phenylalanyl-tRNA--protein transferase [Ottowia sp.]|nr:leucyl/phenylalanyl-tRNA--protein transferase [Ottowia sp.]
MKNQRILPLLRAGEPFPPAARAWPAESPAPGLLCAGGTLDVATLRTAYGAGIFPWYGPGEPLLWWSPDPRMVLRPSAFRVRRSLRKTLRRFMDSAGCTVRFDTAFPAVIEACARAPRPGQSGTWIVPEMRSAYNALHEAGHAHSVETWVDGELVGGLYCVALGRAVFGESMFAHVSDASKIALAALVAWCLHWDLPLIDCQQNTPHLAFLGAREIARSRFLDEVTGLRTQPAPPWQFKSVYWQHLLEVQPD